VILSSESSSYILFKQVKLFSGESCVKPTLEDDALGYRFFLQVLGNLHEFGLTLFGDGPDVHGLSGSGHKDSKNSILLLPHLMRNGRVTTKLFHFCERISLTLNWWSGVVLPVPLMSLRSMGLNTMVRSSPFALTKSTTASLLFNPSRNLRVSLTRISMVSFCSVMRGSSYT